ncbi:uncharacterized protein LOC108607498 [Drosophila busckii]|uniref:uncharacterized protein LOC108607498 n=1 Tax=Drosophila busckii TaxID=30019 RepID=UPI00083E9E1F|nr:uncharacterized protein LOC108607498 [Drosophila busckii]
MQLQYLSGILLITLATLLLPATEAALVHGSYKNEAHPGKCYIDAKTILSPGQTATMPGQCEEIQCHENSEATITSCGVYGPPPGCKLGPPKQPKAKYPDCCEPTFVCA